jgi:hypothetical protein
MEKINHVSANANANAKKKNTVYSARALLDELCSPIMEHLPSSNRNNFFIKKLFLI